MQVCRLSTAGILTFSACHLLIAADGGTQEFRDTNPITREADLSLGGQKGSNEIVKIVASLGGDRKRVIPQIFEFRIRAGAA